MKVLKKEKVLLMCSPSQSSLVQYVDTVLKVTMSGDFKACKKYIEAKYPGKSKQMKKPDDKNRIIVYIEGVDR